MLKEPLVIETQIAGLPIRALAAQFGTPTYFYDRAKIEERIADLRGFPVIRYAQKANPNLAILALMRRNRVLVDAVSAGEIRRAMKAGYEPHEIVYTSDIFDHPALDLVERLGIPVNCGSPDMISQLGCRCPRRSITLRINPGFGHGHSRKTNTGGEQSKHGIWHEQLPDCLRRAEACGLQVTGLHMHIGSGTDFEHLAEVCQALSRAAELAGPRLTTISVGGGLPIAYRPEDEPLDVAAYTALWMTTKDRLEQQLGTHLDLEVEPGRYLVAEAGYLVAEIRAIKTMGRNTFYLLNAGFNNLPRPILYGAYHPMSICPVGETTDERNEVVVGGPLCESGDIFTQSEGGVVETRLLPAARVGDLLTIGCAGGYSFTMGSNYNSFPYAAEVLISGGKASLIRRRQEVDELFETESIPADI
jgi:diaminopimelate decarboxylase